MRHVTLQDPISIDDVRLLAQGRFGDMVKGVVDLKRRVMILDADLHADQQAALLAEGAAQRDLWGIILYPDRAEPNWLEFASMINLRPALGNRSRGVDDAATRNALADLVRELVRR